MVVVVVVVVVGGWVGGWGELIVAVSDLVKYPWFSKRYREPGERAGLLVFGHRYHWPATWG